MFKWQLRVIYTPIALWSHFVAVKYFCPFKTNIYSRPIKCAYFYDVITFVSSTPGRDHVILRIDCIYTVCGPLPDNKDLLPVHTRGNWVQGNDHLALDFIQYLLQNFTWRQSQLLLITSIFSLISLCMKQSQNKIIMRSHVILL